MANPCPFRMPRLKLSASSASDSKSQAQRDFQESGFKKRAQTPNLKLKPKNAPNPN